MSECNAVLYASTSTARDALSYSVLVFQVRAAQSRQADDDVARLQAEHAQRMAELRAQFEAEEHATADLP
jgi:hypothetical protein